MPFELPGRREEVHTETGIERERVPLSSGRSPLLPYDIGLLSLQCVLLSYRDMPVG